MAGFRAIRRIVSLRARLARKVQRPKFSDYATARPADPKGTAGQKIRGL